jgi:hypothetical protein
LPNVVVLVPPAVTDTSVIVRHEYPSRERLRRYDEQYDPVQSMAILSTLRREPRFTCHVAPVSAAELNQVLPSPSTAAPA